MDRTFHSAAIVIRCDTRFEFNKLYEDQQKVGLCTMSIHIT